MPPASTLRRRISSAFAVFTVGLLGLGLSSCSKTPVPAAALTSVAGAAFHGLVHGGQQPVKNASIQIYAVGSGGSTALLSPPVSTDSQGNFNVTGKYTCPSASALVYIVSIGGDPGMGANNPNLAEMAALGACGSLSASTYITINEVSTVAAVFELAPYMASFSQVSYGTDLAGITNAFAEVNVLVNLATGQAPGSGASAGTAVPVSEINTLADIIASCVNSTGGTAGDGSICGTLLSLTGVGGQGNTIAAMLQIARNPSLNVAGLYSLISPNSPFGPVLTSAPGSWGVNPLPVVATPVISLAAGTYEGMQSVTITDATVGSTIYYTTDGTTPTLNSMVYGGSVAIAATSTLRAFAAAPGSLSSAVVSAAYTITAPTHFTGGLITTIAGIGVQAETGDGGQATIASLAPVGVAVDAAGNVYTADGAGNVVRKITPAGIITTIAGTGTQGSSGDGGLATSARLNNPYSVAVDGSGNIFIADEGNERIREITKVDGKINTVAGSGVECSTTTGDGGQATSASLCGAFYVAVDASNNLFISDHYASRIRQVTGGIISTVAGAVNGGSPNDGPAASASFNGPNGLAVDGAGNLYIADTGHNTIRMMTVGRIVSTIAGTGVQGTTGDGGAALSARLTSPVSIAVDANSNVYLSDGGTRVRKIDATSHSISTVAGDGIGGFSGDGGDSLQAEVNNLYGMAFDANGALYLADNGNNRVRKIVFGTFSIAAAPTFSPAGGTYDSAQTVTLSTTSTGANIFYTTDGSAPSVASTPYTGGITVNNADTVINAIATGNNYATSAPASAEYVISGAQVSALLFSPSGGTYTTTQNVTITALTGNPTIYYTTDGTQPTTSSFVYNGGPITVDHTQRLSAIAVKNGYGTDFVYEANYKINVPETPGIITTAAGGTILTSGLPTTAAQLVANGVAFDADGNMYISDDSTGGAGADVRKVDAITGAVTTLVDQNTRVSGTAGLSFIAAGALAVNGNGDLYIVDTAQSVVWELPVGSSQLVEVAGFNQSGLVSSFRPTGIGVDAQNNLYITDGSSGVVRKWDGSNLTIVAGSSTASSSDPTQVGDGGPATSAWLSNPTGVAVDASGNLYIADTYHGRIRRVDAKTGNISTIAGTGQISVVQQGGYTGDGGPATAAGLSEPDAIALDSAGNVYLSDTLNEAIRKIDMTTGIIRTVAGNGIEGYSGDGGPAIAAELSLGSYVGLAFDSSDNLYIVDRANSRLRKVAPGGTPSTVTAAPFINNQTQPLSSDSSGNYVVAGPITILMSSPTTQSTIYYTLDGSPPTTTSMQYNGGISLSASATIQAIAVAPGYTASPVTTQAFHLTFKVAPPNFNVSSSSNTGPQTVSISTTTTDGEPSTPGATIYYTTDGTTPTRASTQYTGPFTLSTSTGLQAFAVKTGYQDSDVSFDGVVVNGTAIAPVLSLPAGTYTSVQTVSLSSASSSALIYYTLDGSAPSVGGNLYYGPITVSSTTTIQAIAGGSGYKPSAVTSATYTINLPAAATPTFSPAAGTYTSVQTVAIRSATSGASLYYTTDGSPPTTSSSPYYGPITVSASQTLKAVAIAKGYSVSPVGSAAYVLNLTAAAPTFSPAPGTYSTMQSVTLSTTTPSASIYYTLDGTPPTAASALFTGAISVSATETVRAVTVASGYSNSGVATAAYTIAPAAGTPVFSPAAGTYTTLQTVTIQAANSGATLYYTLDGSMPTTSSTRYIGGITVYASETIKAIAVLSGYANSAVGSAAYTINLSKGTISTLAGTGTGSYSGDGSAATSATINGPQGGVYDSAGNLYIADTANNRIRKVNTAGVISNFAGTGTAGFSGDGGAATSAKLNGPTSLAIDGLGTVYVSDTGNNAIRAIASNGTISTYAGAVAGSAHYLTLSTPRGIAVDSYNRLYIADSGAQRIISTNSNAPSISGGFHVLCGTGGWVGQLSNPTGIGLGFSTSDGQVSIYVADAGTKQVSLCGIGAANFSFTTLAGGGTSAIADGAVATSVALTSPVAVMLDPGYNGNVYFLDQGAGKLLKLYGGVLIDLAGSGATDPVNDGGPATAGGLSSPGGFLMDTSSNFEIFDTGHNRVRKVTFPH